MARLSTKVRCVKQYRMISGIQQKSTAMEISCRERPFVTVMASVRDVE